MKYMKANDVAKLDELVHKNELELYEVAQTLFCVKNGDVPYIYLRRGRVLREDQFDALRKVYELGQLYFGQ